MLAGEGREYILTKNGKPGALIQMEEFESYVETRDVISRPDLMAELRRALDDEKRGRLWERRADGKWMPAKGVQRNRKRRKSTTP